MMISAFSSFRRRTGALVAALTATGLVTLSAQQQAPVRCGTEPCPVVPFVMEGPITAVSMGDDPTTADLVEIATIDIKGVRVHIPATAPIYSPTKSLTPAELVDTTPFAGRTQPGWIGGTSISTGTITNGRLLANDVFVEVAENVMVGAMTSADPLAINTLPVEPSVDPRMPAGPAINGFGFEVALSGAAPGAVAAAEGYYAAGRLYYHTLELDSFVVLNDVPQVSIMRAQCRASADPGRDELNVRGGSYKPGDGTVRLSDPVSGVIYGIVTATADNVHPEFGLYDANLRGFDLPADVCPADIKAELMVDGVAIASTLFALDGRTRGLIAASDLLTATAGTANVLDVLANDVGIDGGLATVNAITQPANGTLVIDGSTVTYTPAPDFLGFDSFTYTFNIGPADVSNVATVTIEVIPGGGVPVVAADTATLVNRTSLSIPVLVNDTDADGLDPASIVITTLPANGLLASVVNGAISVTASAEGTYTFAYTVADTTGLRSAPATVTVTVTRANDAPVAVADSTTMVARTTRALAVLTNDTDVDGIAGIDAATLQIGTAPAAGLTATVTNGQITLAATTAGTYTFTYTVADTAGLRSAPATVTVTVTPANDAPITFSDAFSMTAGQTRTINVLANDTDTDGVAGIAPATLQIQTPPVAGLTVTVANGAISATATTGGTYTFTYSVADTAGLRSAPASVTVTVAAANLAPVATNDSATMARRQTININVLANDTDRDGVAGISNATLRIETPPAAGLTVQVVNGQIRATSNNNRATYTFTYTVADTAGLRSAPATVTVRVQ